MKYSPNQNPLTPALHLQALPGWELPWENAYHFHLVMCTVSRIHTIATRSALLHVRFHVPFHLEVHWKEIMHFFFLKIALHLHRDGLVSSPKKPADWNKHTAKCRHCIFWMLMQNSFAEPFWCNILHWLLTSFPKMCLWRRNSWVDDGCKDCKPPVQGKEPGRILTHLPAANQNDVK